VISSFSILSSNHFKFLNAGRGTLLSKSPRSMLDRFGVFLASLWLCAISVYALKLVVPIWDQFTRYGKLESATFALTSIDNRLGWILFYSFSCLIFFGFFATAFRPILPNFLLLIHSFWRLLESLFRTKFTDRKMHFVNLCAGLLFYAMTPVTLAFCARPAPLRVVLILASVALNYEQFWMHRTLAALTKYSIPRERLFTWLVAPHYSIEIALYGIYAAAAPHVLTLLCFVAFNLGHQSVLTRR
jgi:hypothetical protein